MAVGITNGNGKLPPTEQKLRGGYYTPDPIASFLAKWAVRNPSDVVLEPSCGSGALLPHVAAQLGAKGRVVALELLEQEAKLASSAGGKACDVVCGDAFAWFKGHPERRASFDAVVGNPPFIRYQTFPEAHRALAFDLMREEGLHPTRLTNAWLPFVVLATAALKTEGRLALVLPAELLQVGYAGELRGYLARKYRNLTMLTFRQLLFPDIQQETVLLLGIRADCDAAEMAVYELDGLDDLGTFHEQTRSLPMDIQHASEKWTQYYLTPEELALVRQVEESKPPLLGDYCDVRVGVVTGRNDFFVLDRPTARELGVERWTVPLIGRSFQVTGLKLDETDWEALASKGQRCLLLNLSHETRSSLPRAALDYIQTGEAAQVHEGFKCRIRMPAWWQVPSTWVPDGFLLRQIHDGPRIIANMTGATSTDTIHRLRTKDGVDVSALAAASMNSMTWAFAEIRGRSYGGGVLELEPREATDLPFPPLSSTLALPELDALVRSRTTEQVLDEVDKATLIPFGLTLQETRTLREMWRRLSQRRLNRRG